MAITTSVLTATFYEASGAPLQGVVLTALLQGIDLETKQYVVEDNQSTTSDATGVATLTLFANASGTRFSYYRITATAPDGTVISDSNVSIPATNCNLADVEGNWSGEVFTGGSNATVTGNLTVLGSSTFNGYTGNMTSGTINNTIIGGSTPAAGTFTQLTGTTATINGNLTVTGTGQINGSATIGDAPGDTHTINGSATITGTINGTTIPTSKTLLVTTDIGTSVQAYDADLTTWAGVTPGANVTTWISTPSSANLAAAVTDETGTGALVFANTPTLVTPNIGAATGSSLNLGSGALTAGSGTFSTGLVFNSSSAKWYAYDNGGGNSYWTTAASGAGCGVAANATTLFGMVGGTAAFNVTSSTFTTGSGITSLAFNAGNPSLNIGTGALTAGSGTFSGVVNSNVTGDAAYKVSGWALADFSGNTLQIGNARAATQWTEIGHYIAGNKITSVSSTGLAVTGAVSSTTGYTASAGNGLTLNNANDNDAFLIYNSGSTGTSNIAFRRAGVNHLNLDASGNLGLGVTPSVSWSGKAMQVGAISLHENGSGGNFAYNAVWNGTNWITIATGGAARYGQAGDHRWYVGSASVGSSLGSAFTNTPAMTLDSSGNLLVGVTSGTKHNISKSSASDTVLVVTNTSGTTPYGQVISFSAAAPNDATRYFLQCSDNVAERATIRSNGGLANYSANDVNLSDERLKKDFAPAQSYYDKMKAVEVVTFLYKDQTDTELNLGVKAQQVDAVAPELIDHSGFGTAPEGESPYLAVYQTDFQYAILKALQETMAKLEAAEARLAALEAK